MATDISPRSNNLFCRTTNWFVHEAVMTCLFEEPGLLQVLVVRTDLGMSVGKIAAQWVIQMVRIVCMELLTIL